MCKIRHFFGAKRSFENLQSMILRMFLIISFNFYMLPVLLVVKIEAKYVDNYSVYHQIQITWYGHPAQSPLSSLTFHDVIFF